MLRVMLLLLLACTSAPLPPADSFYSGETRLGMVTPRCDADRDTRSLSVVTEGWTAGGLWSMTTDSHRVEAHTLISTAADPSGAWDELVLELDIVADPRDVVPGSSTAFLCDSATEQALSARLVIYDAQTREVVDCRLWGRIIDWNAVAGYSDCDQVLE